MASNRKYDLIVFGATGYTGKLTSEQILLRAPTTLKWAIAGRSSQKLEALAANYNSRFLDRTPVETFISDLTEPALENLALSTRCLISTVGPYIKHGTPVFAACAKHGTHYVDSTGETPWVKDMIEKYHDTAVTNGAIMIPQCGVESAPAELSAYVLVKLIRDTLHCPVSEIVFAVHDILSGVSGGTIETTLTIFEHCSISTLTSSFQPYALSPIRGLPFPHQPPIRNHPELGLLTTWLQALPDMTLVMRAWGLRNGAYGAKFSFREYRKTGSWAAGVAWMVLFGIISVLPVFAPFRWLARKVVTQPGEGPSAEKMKTNRAEWHGVATADDGSETPRKAFVAFKYKGDCYTLTGILLAQTAMCILFDEGTEARKVKGGVLTPSFLAGERLWRGLREAGVEVDSRMLD